MLSDLNQYLTTTNHDLPFSFPSSHLSGQIEANYVWQPFFLSAGCPKEIFYDIEDKVWFFSHVDFFLFHAALQISHCCIILAKSSLASTLLRTGPCGGISEFAGVSATKHTMIMIGDGSDWKRLGLNIEYTRI